MKKNIIKKSVSFFVAAGLITGMFAGCSKSEKSEKAFGSDAPDIEITEDEKVGTDKTDMETDASDDNIEKEETVKADADAGGKVTSVTVSNVIKAPEGSGEIKDKTSLTNIKNKSGDEEYRLSGEDIIWQNHGEPITYEGESKKALPVEVAISYYMDGKKMTPEEIAGKSGEAKIKIEYKNKAFYKKNVPYPFLAISMVSLSDEYFSDLEVENGNIMSVGDMKMVMGMALPGLKDALRLKKYKDFSDMDIPSSVEIKGKTTNFTLDYTATIFTNGILSEMEQKDIDDVDELLENMTDMGDASKKISKALGKLYDGSDEYGDYLKKYIDGVGSLHEGLSKLNEGLKKVDISDMGKGNEKAIKALTNDSKKLANILKSEAWQNMAKSVVAGAGGYILDPTAISSDANLPDKDKKALQQAIKAGNEAMEAGLKKNGLSKAEIDNIKKAYAQAAGAGAVSALGKTQIQSLSLTLADLLKNLQTLSKMMSPSDNDISKSINKLKNGINQLTTGAGTLAQNGDKMYDTYKKMTSGISKLSKSYKKFDKKGIQKISKTMGGDLGEIFDRVKMLRKADKSYESFSGASKNTDSTVKFIIQTEEIKK